MKKVALLLSFPLLVAAQQGQAQETEITEQKQRLLILPADTLNNEESVGAEVVTLLSDVATRLGRFEVIDRNDLESILQEQSLQLTGMIDDEMVVEIGKIASADEALLVKVLNFYQQGVPPKEEKADDADDADDNLGLLGKIILTIVKGAVENALPKKKDDSDPYPHNIQTTLSVQVKKINIETGKSLDSFMITTGHTGGNRGRSRAIAMLQLRRQALTKLKHFYTLTSEVISVSGREVLLFLGSEIGVRRGTLFEIVKPDRTRSIGAREIVIPGKRVGIVQVTGSSVNANRSIILRNWRPLREGYRALEYTRTPIAFELGYLRNSEPIYSGLTLGLMIDPFHPMFFGGSLRLARTTDDFSDDDFTLGFSGFGGWRFLRTSSLSLAGRVNMNLDLAFRNDDRNHNVTAALLSAEPLLELELLGGEARDVVIGVGYRFGGHSTHWTYTMEPGGKGDDSMKREAEWDTYPPGADISGLFLTVGFKFLSF